MTGDSAAMQVLIKDFGRHVCAVCDVGSVQCARVVGFMPTSVNIPSGDVRSAVATS